MSELINNREYRKKVLKELIMELHDGLPLEAAKERFKKLVEGIAPTEISDLEQELIMEGMPAEEVQRLCDVHAALFKGSIQEIQHPEEVEGHPVHTFKQENRAVEKLINEQIKPHLKELVEKPTHTNVSKLIEYIDLLWEIDKHYSRKENLLFPYLEKHGITAPPQVMWGVDDEIREKIKKARQRLKSINDSDIDNTKRVIEEVLEDIKEMIFKEEKILFPMALDTLTHNEWLNIARESKEIGFCLIQPEQEWLIQMEEHAESTNDNKSSDAGLLEFETGTLTKKQIDLIFNTLPVDITFIDENDVVRYFSHGKDRIFARTKSVIGRKVQDCHPPASVHVVEKLLEDFKNGKKDHEDFWIKMNEMYVYIRYFALRDEEGKYLGTMEVTQNIQPFREISGEKRLLRE